VRVPLQPQFGPTLGQLLAPRWRRARLATRLAVALGCALALVAGVTVVLNLLDTRFTHRGRVPFSFSYKGLSRTKADPGGYVKVARRSGDGRLEDSYAVAPLSLPGYGGSVTGVLPLAAARYAGRLARRFAGFRLEGEGKTKISASLSGYALSYSALVEGRKLYGRDVMLVPERPAQREGVVVEMLSAEPATVTKPVASGGVLEKPLKSFSFG
jgi:hypothetical protein